MKPRALAYYRCLAVLFLILCSAPSHGSETEMLVAAVKKPAAKKTAPKKAKPRKPAQVSETIQRLNTKGIAETPRGRTSRIKINSLVGVRILEGTALNVGFQFGRILKAELPFYVGPEFNFSLYSGAYVLDVLGGLWYEFRFEAPGWSFQPGLLLGAAFVRDVPNLGNTNLAAYVDLALAKDLDDLATFRIQGRAGYVGSHLALLFNFNICFRFY